MLKTNLSTRPFYNEAAVRAWLVAIAILAAAATLFNVTRVLHYSRNDTELALQASRDEARATELRASAARLRASVDTKQIAAASIEAREANDLIERRTFSWTELFNRFEATLPPNVRITSVRPKLDEKTRRITLGVTVLAQTVDDMNQFLESLQSTGAFTNIGASLEEHINDAGQLEVAFETAYVPHPPTAPADVPSATTGQRPAAAPAAQAGQGAPAPPRDRRP
jgi:Tfp pilus assembly protein PilN